MYDLAALEAALAGTVFAGKLHFSPITGSTNTDALTAARSGAPHGSVYFADEQRAGRGRGHHAWQSAAGQGLYLSVLLRRRCQSARLPLLSLAAGLAAVEAIRDASGRDVDIALAQRSADWPSARPAASWWSRRLKAAKWVSAVVGIGINVHQRVFDPELGDARDFAGPGSGPSHQPPGPARFPAKIAGARDRWAARTGSAGHDSQAR